MPHLIIAKAWKWSQRRRNSIIRIGKQTGSAKYLIKLWRSFRNQYDLIWQLTNSTVVFFSTLTHRVVDFSVPDNSPFSNFSKYFIWINTLSLPSQFLQGGSGGTILLHISVRDNSHRWTPCQCCRASSLFDKQGRFPLFSFLNFQYLPICKWSSSLFVNQGKIIGQSFGTYKFLFIFIFVIKWLTVWIRMIFISMPASKSLDKYLWQ